jgi:hypothetical protein
MGMTAEYCHLAQDYLRNQGVKKPFEFSPPLAFQIGRLGDRDGGVRKLQFIDST